MNIILATSTTDTTAITQMESKMAKHFRFKALNNAYNSTPTLKLKNYNKCLSNRELTNPQILLKNNNIPKQTSYKPILTTRLLKKDEAYNNQISSEEYTI